MELITFCGGGGGFDALLVAEEVRGFYSLNVEALTDGHKYVLHHLLRNSFFGTQEAHQHFC